ncbi:hypothetical protein C5167_031991 [Papaver somniferum]|uniref:Uncharacterized protein n=1 Tax=Papaver somniferum TaxID=3469 RepID=A0A4Y7K5W7_PAPSO|nr:hypothetical protein C5167_031991 [Papaver somniferum]
MSVQNGISGVSQCGSVMYPVLNSELTMNHSRKRCRDTLKRWWI